MDDKVIKECERILEKGNDAMLRKRRNRDGKLETVVFEIHPIIANRVKTEEQPKTK